MNESSVVILVLKEVRRAESLYPPLTTKHQGYAVILEELDELWDEIKTHDPPMGKHIGREEAIHTAAMVFRFLIDLC